MNPCFKIGAETIFYDMNVKVATGNRFLGAFIGDLSGQNSYVMPKVQKWVGRINVLSNVATAQPQ